jgi:hypothetical protein
MKEETVYTPGYMGFIPSCRSKFGKTYGDTTRYILQTEPSLKQGKVQTEFVKARLERSPTRTSSPESHLIPNQTKHKYQTGDDRFSFPPVPGYTGFIPRSKDHFGHTFVETTNSSLIDFKKILNAGSEMPPRVQTVVDAQKCPSPGSSKKSFGSNKPTFTYSAHANKIGDHTGNFKANKGSSNQPFIAGYTGFVPRLHTYFGEPYTVSVGHAVDEFAVKKSTASPYSKDSPTYHHELVIKDKNCDTRPIPGSTIYIPGNKYCFATTYAKGSEISYAAFNARVNGKMPKNCPNSDEPHALPKTLYKPISGYRGHIPGKSFALHN